MSVNARAVTAFGAMKALGIPEKRVRPVLKNLLKLYDKNWELIEDENYRVLLDAIFNYQENEAEEAKKKKEAPLDDEFTGPPFKRLHSRQQEGQASPSGETSFRTPKLEEAHLQQNFSMEEREETSQLYNRHRRAESEPISPQRHLKDKQKELASPQACPRLESEEPSQLHLREKRAQPDPVSPQTCFQNKGKEPVLSPQTRQRHERDEQSQLCFKDSRADSGSVSPQAQLMDKGKDSISPKIASRKKRAVSKRPSSAVCFKEPKVEPGIVLLPKEKLLSPHQKDGLIKPKSEPFTGGFPQFEALIALIHPPNTAPTSEKDMASNDIVSKEKAVISKDQRRARWTNRQKKIFIDLCLLECNKGGRLGSTLHKNAWNRVILGMKKETKIEYGQKQLKNLWDFLKGQYVAWCKLMSKMWLGYNAAIGMFNWAEEEWDKYIKVNKNAASFCNKPLMFEDDLMGLFYGIVATGAMAYGLHREGLHPGDDGSLSQSVDVDFDNDAFGDFFFFSSTTMTPHSTTNLDSDVEGPRIEKRCRKDKKTDRQSEISVILEVFTKSNDDRPTVEDCIYNLNKMSSLLVTDPLYYVAINTFVKLKEHRKALMTLEGEDVLINWLQTLR